MQFGLNIGSLMKYLKQGILFFIVFFYINNLFAFQNDRTIRETKLPLDFVEWQLVYN